MQKFFVRCLHGVTRLALVVQTPLRARRTLAFAGRPVRMLLQSGLSPMDVAKFVEGRGTCLSRALTVAAVTRDAEVVIGVDPTFGIGSFAHAWVEVKREPICKEDVAGVEIARIS